jgi:polar amino acid transport system permease protein
MFQNFLFYIGTGTIVTIGVTLVALPMGFTLGLIFALLHIYGGTALTRLMTLYSTVMRGIPPIVLLFIIYFIIAGSINISAFWAGSISLGIVSSGYQMEIFRGALLSVGGGQMMAARSIGMSRWLAIRYVVLPQALRLAIPPWSNEASIVLKDSSLVYALGVTEILRRAQQLSATTQQPFLAFGTAALIYFLLVFTTNRLLDEVQRRTRIPAHS